MATAPTYLVVIDETPESRVAMRFAVLRAAHVGAEAALVTVIPPAEFMQWGAVQDAMAAEALAEAEALLSAQADEAEALTDRRPATLVLNGEPAPVLLDYLRDHGDVRALVLGAAPRGAPGPLVDYFAGECAGQLPCVLIIVPGGLDPERLASIS